MSEDGGKRLHAGAARADITPEIGIQLAGDCGRYRPVEEVRERLLARALVLEWGERRFCVLSLDLLGATNGWATEVRRRTAEALGIALEDVMFHVTQNHAAPSLGHCFVVGRETRLPEEWPWLRGGDDRYNEPTVKRTVEAATRAAAGLKPVSVHAGRAIDGRVAFNRRFVMRDGTARRHPRTCDPEILHVEGPTDPEVGVLVLRDAEGNAVAALLHHTCHPTHGYPNRYVIADWPGVWAAKMEEVLGGGCLALPINGCCGNIHHRDHTNPQPGPSHVEMAEMLTATAEGVLDHLATQEHTVLSTARTLMRLPLREVPDWQVKDAERILREHPQPMWKDEEHERVDRKWVDAATRLDLRDHREESPASDYEVQVLRIADTALVAVMGEPFVELQLKIKLDSPARESLVAHFCNGYAGYIPTPAALRHDVHASGYGSGQEGYTNIASKFEPEAFNEIAAAAARLTRQLWSQ